MKLRVKAGLVVASTLLLGASAPAGRAPTSAAARDAIGVTIVGGLYSFTAADALNEGAEEIAAMGIGVIKVWLLADTARIQAGAYSQNARWRPVASLRERAADPYFKALFARPFHTFILESFPRPTPTTADELKDGPNWRDGLSDSERERTERDFYDLALYLLATYRGSGKTFILQNWEGDNDLKKSQVDAISIKGMTDWIAARQTGVERARAEARRRGINGVTVAHAFETNNIATARAGEPDNPVKTVIPRLSVDLYSYSVWDASMTDVIGGAGIGEFRRNIAYLRRMARPSALYGRRNIMIGEYGCAESYQCGTAARQVEVVRAMTDAALAEDMRYIVYWELYDNEPHNGVRGPFNRYTTRGFWLRRPDGSYAPVHAWLKARVRR